LGRDQQDVRRGEVKDEEENMVGVLCEHVWKYHNEMPHFVQLICANKMNSDIVDIDAVFETIEERRQCL
jgi:hypothetical protein